MPTHATRWHYFSGIMLRSYGTSFKISTAIISIWIVTERVHHSYGDFLDVSGNLNSGGRQRAKGFDSILIVVAVPALATNLSSHMVRGAARWFCHIGMVTWSVDHKFAEKTLAGTKENMPLHRLSEIQVSSASFSRLLLGYGILKKDRSVAEAELSIRVLNRDTELVKDTAQMNTLCTSLSIKTSLNVFPVNFAHRVKSTF